MTEQRIVPRYKLMLFYDLITDDVEVYYDFVMSELVPALRDSGLHMAMVYHTLWGTSPIRQVEFVAEDLATIQNLLSSDLWQALEVKLLEHATNYKRKVVRFRPGFQF